MRASTGRLAMAAGLSLLAGCNLAPRYDPPQFVLPESYQGSGPFRPAQPQSLSTLKADWWTLFGDAELDRLEGELARANPTLQAAAEAYTQARDLAAEAQSVLYPQLGVQASTTDNRQSEHRLFRSSAAGVNQEASNVIGATASWELDFWDALRNRAHAQKRLAQASAADLADARLSFEAELANDYVAVRGKDAELVVLRQSIAAYQKTVEITRLRLTGKIASGLDLARAASQLSSAQAQETDARLQRDLLQHAIAVLVGETPSVFTLAPAEAFSLSAPRIPPGVPSELLERRPDIARAERQMASANAAIGIARAAFYPHVTFSATGGFEDDAFHLFSIPNSLWSVGAGAVLPLFEGGLRRAELQRTWAAYAQTRDDYRSTVLQAFQEVEDALSLTHRLESEVAQQHEASEQAAVALDIATRLYRDGLDNYLSVAVAQVQSLAARTIEVQVRTRQLQASIALIRSLGGAWTVNALPSEEQTLPLRAQR